MYEENHEKSNLRSTQTQVTCSHTINLGDLGKAPTFWPSLLIPILLVNTSLWWAREGLVASVRRNPNKNISNHPLTQWLAEVRKTHRVGFADLTEYRVRDKSHRVSWKVTEYSHILTKYLTEFIYFTKSTESELDFCLTEFFVGNSPSPPSPRPC